MKKYFSILFLLIWMLTACAPQPQPTEQSLLPNDDISPSETQVDLTPAQRTAITALSTNLNLPPEQITLISTEAATWSDACLGVAMKDVMCAEAVTSGKIIVLDVDGVQYEYHVSDDAAYIQPATLALTWTRSGGIAGFCDSMTVFLSGEVYGNQCRSEPNQATGSFADLLSSEEREQFYTWIEEFGQVDLNASDPKGVSDRMEVTLTFYGNGEGALVKSDEQEIFLWIQNLYQKLYS